MFTVGTSSQKSAARTGTLALAHGVVETPCFMTIATKGAVKTIDVPDLDAAGAQIILSNTYHLMLRPGVETLRTMGGLHGLMGWQKPILTDSGGYQVLSLAAMRKVSDDGVAFRSHIDGSAHLLTPEKSQEVQQAIGSDIAMILDDLVDYPVTEQQAAAALERTLGWARHQRAWWDANVLHPTPDTLPPRLLFGIVQGSTFPNLRRRSAEELVKIGFDGYAHGGLSVGEPREESYTLTELVNGILPTDKPRYWMGAGQPHEIVEYVKRGCDMFDCVLPTRNARHGTLYVWKDPALLGKSSDFYQLLHITNEQFITDAAPIDATCGCFTCTNHSRAYVRHLFSVDEPLAQRLATIHNVYFYQELMRRIWEGIREGRV